MRALIVAIVASVAGVVVAAALWPRVVGGEAVQAELRRVVGGITGRGVAVRGCARAGWQATRATAAARLADACANVASGR